MSSDILAFDKKNLVHAFDHFILSPKFNFVNVREILKYSTSFTTEGYYVVGINNFCNLFGD
jgi:hypothetical protein